MSICQSKNIKIGGRDPRDRVARFRVPISTLKLARTRSSCTSMEPLTSSSQEMKRDVKEEEKKKKKKGALGWIEWFRGWMYVIHEMLFQRIMASHLQNPMPLPPVNDLTCIVTGSTSGIGREIARFFISLTSSPCFTDLSMQANSI